MLDSTDRARRFWLGLAFVLAGVLGVVLYAFLGTFVLGIFMYYSARPIYRRLERRVRPASLAAAIALFLLVLPVVVLFAYTAALALAELRAIGELDLATYEELLAPYTDVAELGSELQALLQPLLTEPSRVLTEVRLRDTATQLLEALTAYLGVVLTGLLHLFVALALAFYLLRDGDRLAVWVRRTFPDDTLVTYGRAVDADLQTVFFGNILNAVLTGVIGAIVFSLLAAIAPPEVPVPVPILLGLLAGAGSLVPVIGMKIVYIPVTLYLAVVAVLAGPTFVWFPIVFFVVTVVVVDTIPDFVIRPYVSGRNLHVGAVMFAYIFGPLLFGWYGLFLGPLLLVLITDFARIVLPELVDAESGASSPALAPPPDDTTVQTRLDDQPGGADRGSGATGAEPGESTDDAPDGA